MTWLLAQMSDLHLVAPGRLCMGKVDTGAMAQAAVQRLAALQPLPDLLVLSGDISDDGSVASYDQLASWLQPLVARGMKLAVAMGNHDERVGLRHSQLWALVAAQSGLDAAPGTHNPSDTNIVDDITASPVVYQLRLEPEQATALSEAYPLRPSLRVIVLDSWQQASSAGALGEGQCAWLRAALDGGGDSGSGCLTRTVLVVHHPPFATGLAGMDRIGLRDRDGLLAALSADRVALVLSGHCHRLITTTCRGVPMVVAPSTAHQIPLDFRPEQAAMWNREPPAMMLHRIDATSVVSHVLPVAQVPAFSFRD